MVLPLLGILGLGAAAGIKPKYDNWAASQRGDYNQSVMQGIDPNDPTAMAGALFGGGLLSGSEYQSDTRGAYEGAQGRENALQRARISAGPAYARLAHDKGQALYERNKAEAYDANLQAAMEQAGIPPTTRHLKSAQQGFESATQAQINDQFGVQYAGSQQEARDMATAASGFEQWQRQQDILGEQQAERDAATQQRQIEARDEQRAFDANQDETERQRVQTADQAETLLAETNKIIPEEQKAANQIATTEWAINNLEDANFDSAWWGDTEGQKTTNTINKILEAQKQAAWSAVRSDAPSGEEMEALNNMYPKIEPGMRDEARADLIKQNLRQWLETQTTGSQQRRDAFQRTTGQGAPNVPASIQLPGNFEVVQ